jgi:hypothetical protein
LIGSHLQQALLRGTTCRGGGGGRRTTSGPIGVVIPRDIKYSHIGNDAVVLGVITKIEAVRPSWLPEQPDFIAELGDPPGHLSKRQEPKKAAILRRETTSFDRNFGRLSGD